MIRRLQLLLIQNEISLIRMTEVGRMERNDEPLPLSMSPVHADHISTPLRTQEHEECAISIHKAILI